MSEKILFIETERQSVRAPAIGWACDDSATVDMYKDIGFSPCPTFHYQYDCVLKAMKYGWKFRQVIEDKLGEDDYIYTWILIKELDK